MKVTSNGLDFEVEINEPLRPDGAPVVLMIMGLGMQLIAWPPDFVKAFTDAGYRVVRLDNRDIGLSHKTTSKQPNLLWMSLKYRLHLPVRAAYTLRDMVEDARGVLDALKIERCHVVGASMGGMIAQGLASHHPECVLSLTSIMSTTGARALPQATSKAMMALIARPKSGAREDVIAHFSKVFAVIGSPKFPMTAEDVRARSAASYDRSFYPAGVPKQLAAVVASGDRSDEVRNIKVPTLVLHGKDDPLVPVQHGEDTARKIAGSEFVSFDGMGHDLGAQPLLVERMLPFFRKHTPAD